MRGEREYIESFGLEVPEVLNIGGDEAARRYLTRTDGSEVGGKAMARVPRPEGPAATAQAEAIAHRIAEAIVRSL